MASFRMLREFSFSLAVLLLTDMGSSCPTEYSCTCDSPNTWKCFGATQWPPVENATDIKVFIFINCRFELNLSMTPYHAEQVIIDNCALGPTIVNGSIPRLTSLTSLAITGNGYLNSIEAGAFSGLTALESLDLTNNDITRLPDGVFAGLPNLKKIDLSENARLGVLSANIFGSQQSNITEFSCTRCGINTFPMDLLSLTPRLERLDLSQNNLSNSLASDQPRALNLSQLSELSLDGCELTSVGLRVFHGFQSSLRLVRLGNNKITKIALKANVTGSLDLHNNRLTELDEEILATSPSIRLKLGDNPWACDCALEWLKKIADKIYESADAECYSPKSERSKKLLSSLQDLHCHHSKPSADHSKSSLAVAAVVCSVIGLVAIFAFFIYRCYVKRRRRSSPSRYTNVNS